MTALPPLPAGFIHLELYYGLDRGPYFNAAHMADYAQAAVAAQAPHDQTALELCSACGWKALIPGDCCLNCERERAAQAPAQAAPAEPVAFVDAEKQIAVHKSACGSQPIHNAQPVAYSIGRTLHWHDGRGVSDAQLYAGAPQWISIADRLPNRDVYVLASTRGTKRKKSNIVVAAIEPSDGHWFIFGGDDLEQMPTHWQPLPAPPAAQGEPA